MTKRPWEYDGVNMFRCQRCKTFTPVADMRIFYVNLVRLHHAEGHTAPAYDCATCKPLTAINGAAVCKDCWPQTEKELIEEVRT